MPELSGDLYSILDDESDLVRAFDDVPFPANIEAVPEALFDPFYGDETDGRSSIGI